MKYIWASDLCQFFFFSVEFAGSDGVGNEIDLVPLKS